MDMNYRNPDELLKAVSTELRDESRGKLKIFFGYAAGVGKTYAMLKAAHGAMEKGVDVICGYIEPHARPETIQMAEGLPTIPVKKINQGSIVLNEFDLDAAIARKPELILVDELAHTNAQGSRHKKRYKDIIELLENGIDVYTTVNVQHLESLNDMVASITGILVRERIPDYIFDDADQVELVDIEPQDLVERMKAGHVYSKTQAQRAVNNFFTIDNLTALREIALRRCADRVNLITDSTRIKNKADYYTDEYILVYITSERYNARVIRSAARLANAYKTELVALVVETSQNSALKTDEKKQLQENIHLAQQLGAEIETVYGDDIALQIAEYTRLAGISKVVMGRSATIKNRGLRGLSLVDGLLKNASNLDIQIIPDIDAERARHAEKRKSRGRPVFSIADVLKCIGLLVVATLIGLGFEMMNLSDTNIVAIYILAVLISAVFTRHKIYSIATSFVSVMVFNFFFTNPKYTFSVTDQDYPITFVVMFAVGIIASSFAVRLKNNARQSAQAAYRTKIMFDTNWMMQQAMGEEAIVEVTAKQLIKLLEHDIIVYLPEKGGVSKPYIFPKDGKNYSQTCVSENEQAVAAWVMKNNKRAGATTNTLADARCMYLAIRAGGEAYGVVGISMEGKSLDSFENSILLSILGEAALALENEKHIREKEEAAIMAKNEQLRSNLLRAISHDLRTPLTSISGNASNLMTNWKNFDSDTMESLFKDIHEESIWLINMVENLLSVTRLEEGRLELNVSTELVEDILNEALRHTRSKSEKRVPKIELEDELMMVRADAKLIVQLVVNLVDNALKYTPKDADIKITAKKLHNRILIMVADSGSGIPDDKKDKVFEMFYCGANKIVDSRKSLGLGLALCKSIVTIHGGEIWVSDNEPHGACFNFTLPAMEVDIHE